MTNAYTESLSGPYFPHLGLNSDQIQENTDQKNSEYGQFYAVFRMSFQKRKKINKTKKEKLPGSYWAITTKL